MKKVKTDRSPSHATTVESLSTEEEKRRGVNVDTLGEEPDMEVAGEEDERVEALLHYVRHHMRRRPRDYRLRRDAAHQHSQP